MSIRAAAWLGWSVGAVCRPALVTRPRVGTPVLYGLGVPSIEALVYNDLKERVRLLGEGTLLSAEENQALVRRILEGVWDEGNLDTVDKDLAFIVDSSPRVFMVKTL